MNNKMTKAELQTELRAAEKQILELESSLKKVTEQSQLSTAGTPSSVENEALFSRVFQISPNPMALSDLETSVYVEVNDAFIRTFGYTKEEIIGRTARDLHLFVDPDQRDQLVTVMKAQGYLRDANLTLRTKTGQIRHGVFSAEFVQVQNHNLLLTAMNDITDIKQSEDVLLKSEARFVTIFENSPVSISITRISDLKIIHVNSAFMKMYGLSREEILGHTAAELEIWADLNERQRFIDLLKTQKKVTDFEAVAKYRSGKEKNMLISGEVVEIDNEACFLVQIIDITERKQAELELHQSWENYKTLFENNPHPMWVYDRETLAFLMVNDAAIQHYGYSREEFLKMTILDIRPSEDHKALKENVGRVTDGLDQAGIWRHIKKDGSLIYVEITSHTLQFNGREAALVHADDVTERVRATSALQASEANYRNLVEKSESAIAVVDRDGKILFANEKGKEIWHETEFIGKTIYDVFPREYANSYLTAIRSVIDSQISIMDEIESFVAGKSMWFRISMTPLRNPDDSVSSLLLNAWDITDNKIAEQLLHESEEKYRTLVNSSADGVFVAQNESFVFCNSALPSMLGYTPEEFKNIPFAQVIAPEHLDIWTRRFQQRIEGKETVSNYQVQFLDKTGTKRIWIELRANQILFNKKPAVLGIARDITEQKQILEEMENIAKFPAENPAPVLRIDLNGKLLYANEASYALLSEWALEIGKPAPVILQQVAALVIESGQDKTIETTHKDHVVTLNFILLKHREYINIYGLEITQQRLAEEKLRESEIRARAMLDAYPDLMFRMNQEGIFLDYKADVQDLYPQDTPSLIGLRNRDVTPPEFSSLIEKKIQESLNSGKLQTFEYRLPLADQKVHDFEARMTPSGKDEVVAVVRDITNRKNLEREILQVNERFTELAESVSDIFWVTQPKIRKHLYVNPAFAVITGFSAEAVDNLPNGYLDIVVPEDQHIVIKVREQEDNGLKTDTKYRILQPDGSIRWIHDRATPVFDETGNVVRVVGVSSDITEQVEAEKRLNESETRFRQIAETIPEVFWVFDNEQNQLAYISPAFESVWGYSGRTIYENDEIFIEAILPEDRNLMFTSMEKQNRGEHTEIEYRIVRPDGSIRWIHDRSFPVFDEQDGHLKRTAGIATDITEQKLAGDALRDREERLRLTLDASHQGLYDLNLQTGEAITNHEYAEMLGYSPETFVETDKAWMERLHPDDKERTVHTYLSYINGLIPEYRTEFRQMTKDGKWKWILSVGKIVENDPTGKPLRMLGIHLDIDSNKQAELELHRRATQLSLINDVGKKIAGVLDIQGVLDLSANLVHDSFGYHHVGLFTINDEKSHMLMRAKAGEYSSRFPDNHSIKLGEGIVGTVGLSGEMVLTNQVNEDPIYINFFPEALDTVSELGLPIKYAGRVIGVLDVQSPLPNAFSADDIQVLQTLADQVAIALENARLYESGQIELAERQKLIYDLEKLVEAGHALSETLNPQAIYPLIYSYVSKVMPCDFIIVSSYDPEFELIRCEYLHTPEGPQQVTNFPPIPLEPPGQGTQSLVIRSGKSLLLSDYEKALQTTNNTLYFNEQAEIVDETYEEDDRTRSAVLVPLKVNGIVTGVLQVLSTKLNAHTQEHLRYTEALAFHVSSALSNARLFSELEERVRQRTAEVQDLYDNAPAGYHSLDINGKIMLINQTELNWLGYTREEMIGHLFSDFLTQESVQTFQQTFPIFKYHGNLSDLELNLVCKDGSVLPVLVNAIAVKDEDGNYLMSRSTVFDNTERKKAELALQDREKVYRALFESANDAIFLLQPDGTILGANPRSSDLLGIPHEALVGKHALDFIAKEENKEAEGQTDRVLAGETLPVYERTFIRNDGTLVNTEINLSLIRDETNKPKYIQSVVRDISGRKRAEETLRLANAEMERALRLKDEFLANMSHELRTPLNAILGITESLLEQISGSLNEKQQKYLQTVLESAQHLLELINDILDLAKINAGRIELDISRVDINSVIHTSMRMIRELAQKKGLNVNLEVDPTVIATWADERRLKQMLVNLLSNAVKFTPKGGEIGLIIHGNKSDQVLNFTVWDTGIGIKQEDIRLLFQPFVQLDAGLARGSQGTGLGLVLVSQMARLHGGSVTVESEPQQGSRFTITIPWVTMEKQDRSLRETHLQPPVIESSVEKKPAKDNLILLVEDTDAVTMLISDYLKRHGYKVVTARDGFEGIARINETVPDLILMDVMMPELDGIETTRRIRTQLGLSHIPIIALTALAMAGDRERCLEAGMNGYLSKPVKLKELLETIEHYLKPGKEGLQ